MLEIAVVGFVLASPVIGALVYAAGLRRASWPLRVLGVAIAFGVWVAVLVLIAVQSE